MNTIAQKRFSRMQSVVICTVIITFILAEVGTFYLTQGFLVIISQIFYFPIIFLSFKYPRNAVPLSLGISCVYLAISLMVPGTVGSAQLLTPLMQFYVYISLSIVLASLFSQFRVSETKYQELFRHSGNAICIVDSVSGTISETNPRFCEMLGIPDPKGKKIRIGEVLPPSLVEVLLAEPYGSSPGNGEREICLQTHQGPCRDVLASLTRIDEVGLTALTLVDISKRKLAEREIAAQATRLAIINRIISLSGTKDTPEALIKETLQILLHALRFESGGIYLIDRKNSTAHLVYGEKPPVSDSVDIRDIPLDQQPFASLLKNEGHFIDDLTVSDSSLPHPEGLVSVAAVPVSSGGVVIGAVTVGTAQPHKFTGDEVSVLRAIGQQLGTTLEKMWADEMLRNRRAILEAVSYAADRFLKEPLHGSTWSDEIPAVIERLGKATGAGRVCIFRNSISSGDLPSVRVSMTFEWTAPSFYPRIGHPGVQDIPYRTLFPEAYEELSHGRPAFLSVSQLPFLSDEYAQRNRNLSLINIPIMAESHWWGILTIEQGSESHAWSQIEIDALMTAAEILGAAIYHRTMVELYQNPVEHSLVGIFLLRDENLEYVNPRFAEIFGYTRDELAGRPFISILIDPDDRGLVEMHRLKKVEGREESAHYTIRGIKKDGTRIVLELYSKAVDYQGHRGIIGTIMDITERTEAETALHESEDMFRSLSQIAPVGIFLLDSRGNYFFVNDQWCRIMDITIDEAAGSGWLTAIHPDDRKSVEEQWRSFIGKGDDVTMEQRLLRKDGSVAWIYGRALARRNTEGNVTGYVGTIVDITERKKYEETLKASLDEKSILIMEIHHRVKNNLQIISGLIRLQARQITSPQALDALRECETRVITMALVHESLYQSGNLANISARRHITNLANTLLMSDERDVKVTMDVDVDDISLDMNTAVPASLIINELVINSLKHAFTGREKGTIHIRLRQEPGGLLELTVGDDGVGIPPGIDITRTSSLGLKLVMRLVKDQLKGTVAICSDHGTSFLMRFPPGQAKDIKGAQ